MNLSIRSSAPRLLFVASAATALAMVACSGGSGSTSSAPLASADAGTAAEKQPSKTTTPTAGTRDAGAKPPPTSTGSNCGALVACLAACPDDDEACSDGCVAKASPDAVTQIKELVACIDGSNCEDATCAKQACPAEFAGCEGLD